MAIVVTSKGTAQDKSAGTVVLAATFSVGDAVIVKYAGDSATNNIQLRKAGGVVVRQNGAAVDYDILANNAGNVVAGIMSFLNLTSQEATDIIDVAWNGSAGAKTIAVYGVSGLLTTAAKDKTVSATGASANARDSGATATLAQADELVVGCVGYEGPDGDVAGTLTTGDNYASDNNQRLGTTGGGAASIPGPSHSAPLRRGEGLPRA